MTSVAERLDDRSVVSGRVFARTGPDGIIDGQGERGIYAEDLRLVRRVEAYRAERETPVHGGVAVGQGAATVRFDFPAVEPGTGVLVVVELDGTDVFTVRDVLVEREDGDAPPLGLGEARPDARVRIEAHCEGAELQDHDGVARSEVPIAADGTARTASWRWHVAPEAGAPVDVTVEIRLGWALSSDEQPGPARTYAELDAERRTTIETWLSDRPRVMGVPDVAEVLEASLADLASLRIDTEDGCVLAAGVPWFLTVFGRDALLSSWMALPVDPDLAVATLRHLARYQAVDYDLSVDSEPGKILHEERRGVAATRWHERYYGAVDSTPLFLMLLAEVTRWTGSDELARELEQPARRAVAWIQSRIDEDELGLIGFWRRSERGLDVQSWKDSADSQRDHAGRVATGLIRPLEAQAYGVAALRAASRLAAACWDDGVVASEWAGAARSLERRLLERCFVELPPSQLDGERDPRHGGFLAQGVDSAGLPLDSFCSNAGHVLWADALADPALRSRIIHQLADPALDSGWGIRTMSTLDTGFDPSSYHCGSVWPHDTALCIAGISRYDRETAGRLARNLFDAAAGGGGRLPELFSGFGRDADAVGPEPLPVACSPQAWAAAAPILLLRSLLCLEPDSAGTTLVATSGRVPEWLAGLRWNGVRALGERWDVAVGVDGVVDVSLARP
ncbi:MAG: hypothetical protein JWM98_588 [Thermoleophilia bacterium]|nr:hypothetical protein [Thermoleophilia bacterium]